MSKLLELQEKRANIWEHSFPEDDGIRVSFLSTINYRRINYDKRRYNQT